MKAFRFTGLESTADYPMPPANSVRPHPIGAGHTSPFNENGRNTARLAGKTASRPRGRSQLLQRFQYLPVHGGSPEAGQPRPREGPDRLPGAKRLGIPHHARVALQEDIRLQDGMPHRDRV